MSLLTWLRNSTKQAPLIGKRTRPASPRRRLRIEAMEDRQMMSVSPAASFQVGDSPTAIVAADLNGDGKQDIITANAGQLDSAFGGGPSVSVLLGKGTKGSFEAARKYDVSTAPTSLVVGKFNNDAYPDLVTGAGDVLLGNGDGTFRSGPATFGIGNVVDTGDFNNDQKLDLVTTYGVLRGNGDGTFGTSSTYGNPFAAGGGYRTPGEPMALGQFTNDSNLDLIIPADSATGSITVSLLPGNGNGTFGAARTIFSMAPGGSGSWHIQAVTAADFNGDKIRDVAVSYAWNGATGWNSGGAYVDTLLGNVDASGKADGTFRQGGSSQFTVGLYSTTSTFSARMRLVAADFNADGKQDLITVGEPAPAAGFEASVLLGKGDGTFSAAPSVLTPFYSTAFTVADFNSDGYADLAAIHPVISVGYVDILLNDKQWGTKRTK